MMEAQYLGLHAIGWHDMLGTWPGKVLAIFILTTVIIGGLYIAFVTGRAAFAYWQRRRNSSGAPASIARYLHSLKETAQRLPSREKDRKSLKSFGVYLGTIADPPTPAQGRLLSQWDVIVVDPLQQGVVNAVDSHCSSTHILGRLDVSSCLGSTASTTNKQRIESLGIVTQSLASSFKNHDMQQTPFQGVLLSNWEEFFGPAVLNHLLGYINHIGLDVWLEISGLANETQYGDIDMGCIQGIVFQNATISPDGLDQDYYQMSKTRSIMRALARRKPAGSCTFAMWEVVDDEVTIPHHVMRRTLKWCNYNTAMSWIGPRSALVDADIAASRTVMKEPLSALAWLGDDAVARAHDHWRFNDKILQESSGNDPLYGTLDSFVPGLVGKLKIMCPTNGVITKSSETCINEPNLSIQNGHAHLDPFSVSPDGVDYTGLGCFQLGLDCSATDINELLEAQGRLRESDLLERLQQEELDEIARELRQIEPVDSEASAMYSSIQDLVHLLSKSTSATHNVRVWVGLHSGFRTCSETQVSGIYEADSVTGTTHIYLSSQTTDRTGAILHTFLSSRGFTRFECFTAEISLSAAKKSLCSKWGLPARLVRDVEGLTPVELLLWTQRLSQSTCDRSSALAAKVRAVCENQLLNAPSLAQLRRTSSVGYLGGKVTAEQLVQGRLQWYQTQGGSSLGYESAVALFKEIGVLIEDALINQDSNTLGKLAAVMDAVLKPSCIDVQADFLAMSVFCTVRKLALGEVYLEVLDRNPGPHLHHIQAACFAEFYAVGARCDAYFDTTPNELGRILFSQIRTYHYQHQPPLQDEGTTELPTTYASMDIDLDPDAAEGDTPLHYRITFLGIFAIPALVDIMLLTTVGRGLYLSAFMEDTDKTAATAALMVALLLGGAFGTWISSGGSYYFYSMAFPATSMFVMTRFVAGLAVVIIVGIVTLIGIGIAESFRYGIIFLVYLILLTTYLMVLSTLSIYQMPGHKFQSGRVVIVTCVPMLLVSPLLTTWLHHDIVIYPCLLAFFLAVLLFATRRVISKWNIWYFDIPCVTEQEIVGWYQRTYLPNVSDEKMPSYFTIRQTLWDCVRKERARHFWSKPTSDAFIQRLAMGYPATKFLLTWYCQSTRTRLPLPYSPTWNLQLKSGTETLVSMQKGLKLHSAFLHWVHSGQEVWGGLLFFALALMDKWTALLTGESIVGLSVSSETFRLAVGFGLAYYLMGAVVLDAVSQPLWAIAHKHTPEQVSSLESLNSAVLNNKLKRRSLYWSKLLKYSLLHIWGLAVTAALMWAFESSRSATQMYLAYVGAYSGLLWYQYSRIYVRHRADGAVALGTVVGFTTCLLLRLVPDRFAYGGVIGLAAGTWATALISLLKANVGRTRGVNSNGTAAEVAVYTCSTLEPDPEIPQGTLASAFDGIMSMPLNLRYRIDPAQYPGVEVMEVLLLSSRRQSEQARRYSRAFPQAADLLRRTAELWKSGRILVELISAGSVLRSEELGSFRCLSKRTADLLHVIVITPLDQVRDTLQGRCFAIAEALVSSTAENCLGLSHDHAVLAELLVHGNYSSVSIPEGIKRQLQLQLQLSCRPQRELIASTQRAILRHLLLGIDIDQEWDLLPADVRMSLLQRACGKSYNVSTSQVEWIRSRFKLTDSADLDVWLEIYDMSASLAVAVNNYAQLIIDEETARTSTLNLSKGSPVLSLQSSDDQTPGCSSHGVKARLLQTYLKIKSCIKFTVLSLVADPEYQRELDYMLRTQPLFISWPAKRCLTCIWSFGKVLQDLILPLVLLHGRRRISSLYKSVRGQTVTVERHRVALDMLDGAFTCFMHSDQDGSSRLYQYSGRHEEEPDQTENLVSINTYTRDMVLRVREEFDHKGVSTNRFVYAYEPVVSSSSEARMRVPLQRQCLHGRSQSEILCYDGRGFVLSGSTVKGADPVRFQYWYAKNARSDSDLLRGEYIFPHITIQVAWSIPPPPPRSGQLDEWIPYPSVTRALFIQGDKIYSVEWAYDHRFHPTIQATLNGDPVPVPPMISEDWFNVLQKPTRSSFFHDNPLASFPAKVGTLSRLFRRNIRRYPLSISQGRTFLWKSWRASNDVDAVTARWLDELFLRSSQMLKPYWRRRDRGNLEAATAYLDEHADAIVADVDLSQQVSSWAPLAFNFSDLASFGQGGDSRINTRTLSTQLNDSSSELHVLAMDTGTWPNEPGGVSACRRDLVNNLKQVRWHIIAESANDFGIPRFQVEHNVHSLTILPQWGLDFLHPTHGIFQNCLHSAIVERAWDLTDSDIRTNFLPVLATLVRCARMGRLDRVHVKEATQALVDLNAYFESSRSWNDVWMSDTVKQAWRELWLSEDMEGATPVSQWLDAERPTVPQLDTALDMWHRYLFIFSIPVPEKIPAVFQVSHHWTGATYGVLCKIKRQCVLQLWDHAISFREIAAYLSSALCLDSIFVNHSLISLAHLSCVLIQYHADIVLPCAEYFNPGWEIELGTCEGALQHRRLFSRKIDAVVNGIANMDRYRLNKEAKAAEKPTVVMLSHVRYVKDVKTAILAADVIINNWGFHDYRLKIYGDMERSPAYSSECQQMIDSKGLREHVFLMGLGDPLVALEDAWLFMNSSISEGLPLAMGEAALTGVPVVCTDVGASFCVVTDRASGQRFSEVVAPNDPISLAGAQIRVLALLGQWAAFAEDDQGYTPPTLSLQPSPEEVQQISQRMHDKAEQRRKLGLLGRENIYKNFSSERYLREHEQMLWLGKYRSRRALVSGQSSSSSPEEKLEPSTVLVEQTSSEVS